MSKRVQWIIKNVAGTRVLDVGCAGYLPDPGSPSWLHGELRRRYPALEGIERDKAIVADLRALGFKNIHLADAESFALPQRFDTIVAGEVIEHLSNPGLFMDRARDQLAPGGRLIITTPYALGLPNVLYGFLKFPRTCPNSEHTCWFCLDTLTHLAERHGFRVKTRALIKDYPRGTLAARHWLFVTALRMIQFLIPLRLSSTTLAVVLEPHENPPRP